MPARFRVLMTDRAWPDCGIERDILATADAEIVEPPATDEATLAEFAADCDAILTCWANVTPAVIAAATRCQAICRFGIGTGQHLREIGDRTGDSRHLRSRLLH